MKTTLIGYLAILLGFASLLVSAEQSFSQTSAPDEPAITSIVEAFHKALETGSPDKVMALLAPDALVVEAGNIQTRSDYQREHLADDIAFAHAVSLTSRRVAAVRQEGNVAWVITTSRAVGEFHKRPVNSTDAETIILTKSKDGWLIRAIHWSSQKAGQ